MFVCRAIPEAGYIQLGTLRYGVKLSQTSRSHSRSTSLTLPDTDKTSINLSIGNKRSMSIDSDSGTMNVIKKVTELKINRCDSDNSLSDVTSINGSCCINATKIPLPWIGKMDHGKMMCKSNKKKFFFSLKNKMVLCNV